MLVDVAVCLPKEAQTVSLIRTIVDNSLRSLGVTADCIADICLALSEACNNVIEHAAAGDEYEVRLQVDEDTCAIRVMNTGNGFDAAGLRDTMPDPMSPRGRGVAIMRAVMDRVDFISQPEDGTLVHLVKTLAISEGGPLDLLRASRHG